MAVFISNQSGLWSSASTWLTAASGTLSPTAPAGNAPQSGGEDKFIIRGGHIVTYDVDGEFGDQTTFYLLGTTGLNGLTANSIFLSGGTLKASRTTNTTLTARGNILIGASGILDWGTSSDPLTTTSTIFLNCVTNTQVLSNSKGSAGIYLWGSNNSLNYGNSIYLNGLPKIRNTYLTLSAASGSNVISVQSVSGWNVGDKLIIQTEAMSALTTATGVMSAVITGLTGLNVGISPSLNSFRSTGRSVGNFSGNVTITSFNRLYPAYGLLLQENADSVVDINNISFRDVGYNLWANYGSTTSPGANFITNVSTLYRAMDRQTVAYGNKSISFDQTNTENGTVMFYTGAIPEYTNIEDFCVYHNSAGTNQVVIQFNGGVLANISNTNFYKSYYGFSNGVTVSKVINFNNCNFDALTYISHLTPGNVLIFNLNFNNCKLRSSTGATGGIVSQGIGNWNYSNSYLEYRNNDGLITFGDSAFGNTYIKDCTLNGGKIKATGANAIKSTKDYNIWVYNPTVTTTSLSSVNKYTRLNSYYYADSDFTTRKRGLNSYRIRPEIANNQFEVYETIPAIAGVPQIIKGSLRFDSNYGSTFPPSISFVGAGINTTFTCTSTANIWQDFEYIFNPTLNDDIKVTMTGKSSLTSGYVWLDGLPFYPMIQEVRHYGYVFDKNIYRTVNTLNTSTENQVSALNLITNLDELYDASTYWSVTNPSLTSYIDLVTNNGTLLDFGNRNIILNNTGTGFTYNSASNTIILNSPILSAGTNFNTIKTTGTVTLSTGVIQNLDINANIVQTVPTNLTGIYMLSASNTLTYNTNTPIEIEYTNCTMVGVKNDGNAIVTIKRTNSTVVESDAEITTYSPTLINLTLQGGYIALYDNLSSRQYYTNTDSTLVLGSSATGTWSYRIARYGFNYLLGSFTVDPNVGGTVNIAPNYVTDPFVVAPLSSVQNYTDLNSTQKIHDYMSFFMTTSTGIEYGDLVDYSIGVLQFNYPLTLNAAATSLVTFSAGIITLKSSSLNESFTLLIDGDFNQLNGNTISDGIKIRSNNLDSEFLFKNINSITFYPTEIDRDNNTNAGLTTTATIYRFKYGVVYSNYVYNRITADGIVFLKTTAITTGENIIDLGTTASIQTILGNQKIMNTGIQKASILVPHTTNI